MAVWGAGPSCTAGLCLFILYYAFKSGHLNIKSELLTVFSFFCIWGSVPFNVVFCFVLHLYFRLSSLRGCLSLKYFSHLGFANSCRGRLRQDSPQFDVYSAGWSLGNRLALISGIIIITGNSRGRYSFKNLISFMAPVLISFLKFNDFWHWSRGKINVFFKKLFIWVILKLYTEFHSPPMYHILNTTLKYREQVLFIAVQICLIL